jgi:hypothetical protein
VRRRLAAGAVAGYLAAGIRRAAGPAEGPRPIVGKLMAVANHQHPAAGSLTTGKIIILEPGEPASPLSK